MTEDKDIEAIARELYEQEYSIGYWDGKMPAGQKVHWLAKADLVLQTLTSLGYVKNRPDPELRGKIARIIYGSDFTGLEARWDNCDNQDFWLERADQILSLLKQSNPKEPVESNGATALPTNKKLPPYVFTVGKEPVTELLSRTERHIQEYEESLQKEPCPDDEEEASPINCKDLCENYPKCYPFVSPVACTDFKLKEDGTGRSK